MRKKRKKFARKIKKLAKKADLKIFELDEEIGKAVLVFAGFNDDRDPLENLAVFVFEEDENLWEFSCPSMIEVNQMENFRAAAVSLTLLEKNGMYKKGCWAVREIKGAPTFVFLANEDPHSLNGEEFRKICLWLVFQVAESSRDEDKYFRV